MTTQHPRNAARILDARQQVEEVHDLLIELLAASQVSRAARPTMQLVIRKLKAMGRDLDESLAGSASDGTEISRPSFDTPHAGQLVSRS